jgi:hypothetical protein
MKNSCEKWPRPKIAAANDLWQMGSLSDHRS